MNSPHRRYRERYSNPRPAIFLDRDGVLVEETGYLHEVNKTILLPDAIESTRELNERQIPVIVVTNQAGIGRGYYDWPEFEAVQNYIESEMHRGGAHFDGVWACGEVDDLHPMRKPNPGMLLDAAEALNLDLSRSWMIGDKTIDIQTAIRAALAGAVLVRTGYGRLMEDEVRGLCSERTRILIEDGIKAAVSAIMASFQ